MQILLDAEGDYTCPAISTLAQESIGAPPPSPTVENDYVLASHQLLGWGYGVGRCYNAVWLWI